MIRPITTHDTFDVSVMLRWLSTLFNHKLQVEMPHDTEVLMALIMKTACLMGCDDTQYPTNAQHIVEKWHLSHAMSNVMKLHQHCNIC
jgi:hypothetical protein